MKMSFAQRIMDEPFDQEWPLRGDVYFWNLIRAQARNWEGWNGNQFDMADESVENIVRELYRELTGVDLNSDVGAPECQDYVEFIARISYGMSKGWLSRKWWREYILPEMHRRVERICGDCTDGELNLFVLETDLTKRGDDAIVCPTNTMLNPEGGVGGALRKAGGEGFDAACRAVPVNEKGERCSVGEACVTSAGNLKSRYVIHTVAPHCHRGVTDNDRADLRSCYIWVMNRAFHDLNLKSVAMPSIGTGKNAFPVDEAAEIAAEVLVREASLTLQHKIVLCVPDGDLAKKYRAAIRKAAKKFPKPL